MFSKILIAHDGSDGANKALAGAIRLAKENDAALHLICVEEIPHAPATIARSRRRRPRRPPRRSA